MIRLKNVVISILLLAFNVSASPLYTTKVENLNSTNVDLSSYQGKVLLIANTASGCGYTPQYKDLEIIYQKYKKQGFEVLAFPSNDFGGQEPGSNQEIKKFCDLKDGRYKVSFPIFGKSNVSSNPQNLIFKYLTETANPELVGPVKWNFEKFVIAKSGKLVQRFASNVVPTAAEVTAGHDMFRSR